MFQHYVMENSPAYLFCCQKVTQDVHLLAVQDVYHILQLKAMTRQGTYFLFQRTYIQNIADDDYVT